MPKTRWYDYLWVLLLLSLILPFFNIHLVWLSLAFMAAPVLLTLFTNSKTYCNNYCGRGQLYQLLGNRLRLSLGRKPPRFLSSLWFRACFFILFIVRFSMMMLAAPGADESAAALQTAMLMTTALGLLAMFLFRPRSWCVVCPMGAMTQAICRIRNGKDA